MKYKLLRYSLLSLLVMLCGNVFADEVTMKYAGSTTTNMTGNNDAALFGLDASAWGVYAEKGGNPNFPGLNKAGDCRLYYDANGGNTVTVQALSGATINSVAITYTGNSYSNAYVSVDGENVTGQDGVYTINGRAFVIGNANTSNVQVRISQIVINYGVSSDTRTATTLSLGQYDSTGEVSGTIGLPTATVMAGENSVEDALVTWTSSNENVAVIRDNVIALLATGTSTITATYEGDNSYKGCTASYTVTVSAAYTSLRELQEAATSTSTPAKITFSNIFVTAVKGSNAFLSDADGYGITVYQNDHGLEAGQLLNGSVTAQLSLYQGKTQLSNFSKDGLTITTTEVKPTVKTIDAITAANQSTLVTLKGVKYADGKLTDGTNEITYYDNFNAFAKESFDAEKTYDVTGIVILYNSTLEIAPRTEADVVEATAEQADGFRDFNVELNTLVESGEGQISFGLAIAGDGTVGRVAADAANAIAVVNGKTGNDHGLQSFSATVKVEGAVKITMGTCSWGGEVSVKDAAGQTVATFTTKKGDGGTGCYKGNKFDDENIVSAKYVGEATTLTISGGAYVNFFAVETVNASSTTVAYSLGDVECQGTILPTGGTYASGDEYTIPAKNFTLYKEGYTLTGWTDGTNTYNAGQTITLAGDLNLTPVFTQNEVSLADRTEEVTLNFSFRRDQGAPIVQWQNANGNVWVTQATVKGKTIDVPMTINTNPGKFNNSGNTDCTQTNSGTVFVIPSCKGATVKTECHGSFTITTTTIDGQTDYQGNGTTTITQTVASNSETIEIVIGDGSYYRYVNVVLPVVQQEQTPVTYENEAATIEWAMDNAENPNASTQAPEGAFSTVALSFDDSKVKIGDSKGNVLYSLTNESAQATGVTGIVFSPSAKEDLLTWNVKPAAGLTFTPTKLSGYVNRDGTDVEKGLTVSAYTTGNAPTVLGTWTALRRGKTNSTTGANATTKAYDATAIYKYEIELTPDQQANFASADGFYLTATVGVGSGKSAGFGKVIIEGLLNGTAAQVEKYTLTATTSAEEAGSVTVYPAAETYEAGTEVTLTATKNFGYAFVNWTDAKGNIISEEAKFKYTLNADAALTANFKQVETYELDLTIDGTNEYMVTIDPMPTIVDEKAMYEAGTAVQLTANQYEGLVTFTNWSDGETSSSKTIKMDADVTLEAFFAEADIIAGWDFYKKGNSGRVADFSSTDNETAALSLTNAEGEAKSWLDKSTEAGGGYEGFKGAAVNWTTGSSNGDVGHYYWQTKVNAEAFTDINIQFQMLYNYNAYQKYNVDYSLNGTDWTNVGSITMSGAKSIASFAEILPAEANNQKNLYIRMIADKSSSVDGTASANDGNALAMFFITGTPKLVDDGIAPVLVSSVPANDATGASSAGKIVLNFDEKVKVVAEGSVASLSATPESSDPSKHITLTPTVSGKTITFEYKGLEYATKYYFLLNGNTVSDLTDNLIADPITFSFTTMERPAVTKGSFDAVVSNVEELQAALKAAETRADQNTRFRIFLKNGTYKFPQSTTDKTYTVDLADGNKATYTKKDPITYFNASNVSMIGESRDGVVITNTTPAEDTFNGKYGPASIYEGIGNSDVIQIGSRVSGLYWQDLTVKTGLGDARGRDIAIQDKGRMNIYKNTCLWGYQDTWTSNNDNGLYYFEGGKVRGRTDFLCGKGDMFLNGVDIQVCMATGGYIAVPSKSIKYGFVFKDCTIKGESSELNGKFTLGRPWGSGTPIALWIDTKMEIVPSAAGWNEMSGGWPMRFAEFNSMTANGTPVDLSGRKKVFGDGHENNPVLTAAEALEAGDLHNMFGEWDPTLATEQAPAPKNVKIEGTTLAWDNSQYAFCWAVVKNGSIVAFTNEPTYTIDEASAKWSVRAANEMGGLGEAVQASASAATAISNVNKTAASNTIFDLQGRKVNLMKSGLYIINGKKVVK